MVMCSYSKSRQGLFILVQPDCSAFGKEFGKSRRTIQHRARGYADVLRLIAIARFSWAVIRTPMD